MSNDTQFINGLIIKPPHENAPEYVKAKLSIKREELIATLQGMDGEWVNAEIKTSQNGKWYAAVDTWKPNGGNGGAKGGAPQRQRAVTVASTGGDFNDDDIPFVTQYSRF